MTPPATSSITIASNPVGRQISVDGTIITAPRIFTWNVGSSHTINAGTTQSSPAGTRYVFQSWSQGNDVSQAITVPASATTNTASFQTQYFLTTMTTAGGSIQPSSDWHNSGDSVTITATQSSGFYFTGFSGDLSGAATPQNVLMDAPRSVRANFTACTYAISPTTSAVDISGGSTTVTVTTPSADCPWTSAGNDWVSFSPSSAPGTSAAASVTVTVAPNSGDARSATLSIAQNSYLVKQVSCSQVAPTQVPLPASATQGDLVITAAPTCHWSAQTDISAPWIGASTLTGMGPGLIHYSAGANSSGAQRGTSWVVGGATQVTFAQPACSPAVYPFGSLALPGAGGSLGFWVGSAECTPAVPASAVPWAYVIYVYSYPDGSEFVVFSVDPNFGGYRSGTLTVARQTFTISEQANPVCGVVDETGAVTVNMSPPYQNWDGSSFGQYINIQNVSNTVISNPNLITVGLPATVLGQYCWWEFYLEPFVGGYWYHKCAPPNFQLYANVQFPWVLVNPISYTTCFTSWPPFGYSYSSSVFSLEPPNQLLGPGQVLSGYAILNSSFSFKPLVVSGVPNH